MQRISVSNLLPTPHLHFHVFHDSGELLYSAGTVFGEEHRQFLRDCGIDQVYLLDRFDNVIHFHISQKNKYILVDELSEDYQIAAPICESDGTILLGSQTRIDEALKQQLKLLGYYTVCVRKLPSELGRHQLQAFREGPMRTRYRSTARLHQPVGAID